MKRTIIITAAVGAVLLLGTILVNPSFRSFISGKAESIGTWTPEAQEKDPIGYSNYVERQLKKDLADYKTRRQKLAYAMNDLAKKETDKTKLLETGNGLAGEFAEAIEKGEFPVTVQGKEYTETQIRSQLALILAQTDGLTQSLSEIKTIASAAEQESRDIVVQIEKTESQLSLLSTRREIFRTNKITSEGLEMMAQVNAVLEENQVVLADNPVRTIEQLISDTDENAEGIVASAERVEQFLQDYSVTKGSKKNAEVQTENIPEEPAP